MKKMVIAHLKPKYRITICVEFEDTDLSIAASRLKVRANIAKRDQLDADQIAAYDALISSIMSVLSSHKFKILQEYQSNKSYAYYVVFYPVTPEGKTLDSVEIEFKVGDHIGKGLSEDHTTTTSKARIIKAFVLGGKRYTSTVSLMAAVSKICDELSAGNYEILDFV